MRKLGSLEVALLWNAVFANISIMDHSDIMSLARLQHPFRQCRPLAARQSSVRTSRAVDVAQLLPATGSASVVISHRMHHSIPHVTLLRLGSDTNCRYMHVGPGGITAKVPVNKLRLPHFALTYPTSSPQYRRANVVLAISSRIACQLALWLCGS